MCMARAMTDFLKTLGERISIAIGGNPNAFAKSGGMRISRMTLARWISGETSPSAADLAALAAATGRSVPWFLGLEDRQPGSGGSVLVPLMDVRASAGAGAVAEVVRAIDDIELPRSFLRRIGGEGARLECLRASGASMTPTIQDGALLILDRNRRPPAFKPPPRKAPRRPQAQDDIYVFYHGADVRLKRLRSLQEGFMAAISDNIAEYPIEIFKPGADGAFEVMGAVVWWDNRL